MSIQNSQGVCLIVATAACLATNVPPADPNEAINRECVRNCAVAPITNVHDDATDVAEHDAIVESVVKDDGALGEEDIDRQAFVEYVWQRDAGYVRPA